MVLRMLLTLTTADDRTWSRAAEVYKNLELKNWPRFLSLPQIKKNYHCPHYHLILHCHFVQSSCYRIIINQYQETCRGCFKGDVSHLEVTNSLNECS